MLLLSPLNYEILLHKYFTKTLFLGKEVHYMPTCHSTNSLAMDFIRKGQAFEGMVVWAAHQTAGRGQMGNTWEDAEGKNLLISILLKPSFVPVASQFQLTMIASLAVHDTLSSYLPASPEIKWPNDILYYGKKVCGILIENTISGGQIENSIVGIGVNVNQIKFPLDTASSLAEICQQELSIDEIAEFLLINLEKRYLQLKAGKIPELKDAYHSVLYQKDEWHNYEESGRVFAGKLIGVQSDGKLKMELESGIEKEFVFKQISFL